MLAVLAIICGLLGIVGSIVPAMPGPPLGWLGLLLGYFAGLVSGQILLIWLAVTVVVTVLDYIVPSMFTKLTGGSPHAGRGALAGMILGLVFTPVGMILGTIIGAFTAEMLFAEKGAGDSLKAAVGAVLGFFAGTGIKLLASGWMFWLIISAVIG